MAAGPFSSYLKQSIPGNWHGGNTRWIPSAHDDSSIVGRVLDFMDHFSKLIDPLTGIISLAIHILCPEMSPLESIHGPQIPCLAMLKTDTVEVLSAAVAVPDLDTELRQMQGICICLDEPEELFEDGAEENPFCGEKREDVVTKGEAQLRGREDGEGSCTCAVRPGFTVCEDVLDQIQVLVLFVLDEGSFCRG